MNLPQLLSRLEELERGAPKRFLNEEWPHLIRADIEKANKFWNPKLPEEVLSEDREYIIATRDALPQLLEFCREAVALIEKAKPGHLYLEIQPGYGTDRDKFIKKWNLDQKDEKPIIREEDGYRYYYEGEPIISSLRFKISDDSMEAFNGKEWVPVDQGVSDE